MAVGSFAPLLSGFTSDHTYQCARVESETLDHQDIALTGMTWDLLNRGHSAVLTGQSNNPFDLDETDLAYEQRKKKQLKFLGKKLKKTDLDFVFLQEVDIFTAHPLPKMVKGFLDVLKSMGWRVVHSDKEDNLLIPLLTLYDASKLKFEKKRAVFKAKNEKFCALEAEFTHIATGAIACLTNMYLDQEIDHNNEIYHYQESQVANAKFTIIGGDTNAAKGVEYFCLAGDVNQATSVDALKDEDAEEDSGEGGMADELIGDDEYA